MIFWTMTKGKEEEEVGQLGDAQQANSWCGRHSFIKATFIKSYHTFATGHVVEYIIRLLYVLRTRCYMLDMQTMLMYPTWMIIEMDACPLCDQRYVYVTT